MVMFTPSIFQQSPISSLVTTISSSVGLKLDDTNYLQWRYKISVVLKANGIMGFVDGSISPPPQFNENMEVTEAYRQWEQHDNALMTVLSTTLSLKADKCVMGSATSREVWSKLRERFGATSQASILQMKTNFQTIKKGNESIDEFLQRIKDSRDELSVVGVEYSDEDVLVVVLNGLPEEFGVIYSILKAKETTLSMKELRAQLKSEEAKIEGSSQKVPVMAAMLAQSNSFSPPSSSGMVSQTTAPSQLMSNESLQSNMPAFSVNASSTMPLGNCSVMPNTQNLPMIYGGSLPVMSSFPASNMMFGGMGNLNGMNGVAKNNAMNGRFENGGMNTVNLNGVMHGGGINNVQNGAVLNGNMNGGMFSSMQNMNAHVSNGLMNGAMLANLQNGLSGMSSLYQNNNGYGSFGGTNSYNGGNYKGNNFKKGKGKFFNGRFNNYQQNNNSNFQGIMGNPQAQNAGPLCRICMQRCYLANTCHFRPASSNVPNDPCQICGKNNHTARNCHFICPQLPQSQQNFTFQNQHGGSQYFGVLGKPQFGHSNTLCQICFQRGHVPAASLSAQLINQDHVNHVESVFSPSELQVATLSTSNEVSSHGNYEKGKPNASDIVKLHVPTSENSTLKENIAAKSFIPRLGCTSSFFIHQEVPTMILHDDKDSNDHANGVIANGVEKTLLVNSRLHLDSKSHFGNNSLDKDSFTQRGKIDSVVDKIQLAIALTTVQFILALIGYCYWKIKHTAQPPGFEDKTYSAKDKDWRVVMVLTKGLGLPSFEFHCSNLKLCYTQHELEGG